MCTLDIIINELKKQKKSQKELTDYLGVTKNTFTNWKNGNNTSYIKKLPQISEFLNVSVNYLLGNPEETLPSEIAILYNDLNEEGKTKVQQYIKDLLSSPNYIKAEISVSQDIIQEVTQILKKDINIK